MCFKHLATRWQHRPYDNKSLPASWRFMTTNLLTKCTYSINETLVIISKNTDMMASSQVFNFLYLSFIIVFISIHLYLFFSLEVYFECTCVHYRWKMNSHSLTLAYFSFLVILFTWDRRWKLQSDSMSPVKVAPILPTDRWERNLMETGHCRSLKIFL